MLLVTRSKVIGCETGGIPEEMARKLISMMGLPVSDSSMFASRSLLSANVGLPYHVHPNGSGSRWQTVFVSWPRPQGFQKNPRGRQREFGML